MPLTNEGIRIRRRVSRSPTFNRPSLNHHSLNQPICSKTLYQIEDLETEKRFCWIPQNSQAQQQSFAAETVASRQKSSVKIPPRFVRSESGKELASRMNSTKKQEKDEDEENEEKINVEFFDEEIIDSPDRERKIKVQQLANASGEKDECWTGDCVPEALIELVNHHQSKLSRNRGSAASKRLKFRLGDHSYVVDGGFFRKPL
ncbi:unnamed protein product, partial [Mesorhabditis belari]|uniref:Uncharacterized protein n=1 Tax=Mesorhabditis belari TaxID=2138241 RepID=A0AAF3EFZ9_9BILA